MHLIIKKNLKDLAENFELIGYSESKLFEMYSNFCVMSQHYFGRFNPKNVTTSEDDASIDGIAITIDGDLIETTDDAVRYLTSHKSNLPVELILLQAKSGESFSKEEIAAFNIGVTDFVTLEPKLPSGPLNKQSIEILKIVYDNLKKVQGGRPNAHIYYCTTGTYNRENEIRASFEIIERTIKETDLFDQVSVTPLGRSDLLKLWSSVTEKNEAKLKLIDYLGMPEMPNIPQSYIALVEARVFVEKVLCGADGKLRPGIFDENIRAFLGTGNPVNTDIARTIEDSDKKFLFSVLNNGITIVAPEMTLTPNSKELDISNYQIINGCQTSNTLWEHRENLVEGIRVVVKFIQSPNNDVSLDVIAATNSQTEIKSESFHGLKVKAKLVQSYFDAKNSGCGIEHAIYFERRENEFKDNNYKASKLFDIRELARSYAAMFLGLPHHASRYVKTIFADNSDKLFADNDHESLYYCSALTNPFAKSGIEDKNRLRVNSTERGHGVKQLSN
jgi:WD40 repeat protein